MTNPLRALIAKWREKAAETRGFYDVGRELPRMTVPMFSTDTVNALRECADELEAALAAEPCGVVGEPDTVRQVCELPKGHDGYHQQGGVKWVGYHPNAAEPDKRCSRCDQPVPDPGDLVCVDCAGDSTAKAT